MTSDVHVREITIAFVLALCAMVGVFFACGDDDDDDDNGDDDTTGIPSSECGELQNLVGSCYTVANLSATCFNGWCTGDGYDSIGALSQYDFNPSCFSGTCDSIYDNLMNPYNSLYDACESTRRGLEIGAQCGGSTY